MATQIIKDEEMQEQDVRDIRQDIRGLNTKFDKFIDRQAARDLETQRELSEVRSDNKVNAVKIGAFVSVLSVATAGIVSIGIARLFG